MGMCENCVKNMEFERVYSTYNENNAISRSEWLEHINELSRRERIRGWAGENNINQIGGIE